MLTICLTWQRSVLEVRLSHRNRPLHLHHLKLHSQLHLHLLHLSLPLLLLLLLLQPLSLDLVDLLPLPLPLGRLWRRMKPIQPGPPEEEVEVTREEICWTPSEPRVEPQAPA